MITLGLLCIILGWALQFVDILQGEKQISWAFVACYSIGVFLLVTDGYMTGHTYVANLNLLALILSCCVLLMLRGKTKSANSSKPSRKRR
jgi:hypothetical protein